MDEKMKLLREYIRKIVETSDKAFLDEFMPIYDEWEKLQATYGPVHKGPWTDPESGETHWPKGQDIPDEKLPTYVKGEKYYGKTKLDHPAARRASHSQTQEEVDIEKKLLRLFQKHVDRNFFDGVTLYHDLNYRSHFVGTFSDKFAFSNFSREQYLSMEGRKNKNVISCYGSTDGSIQKGDYGMIIKGHVIFASRGDLASQTMRTAHKKVKEKHKSSGIPKRTSPGKVHPSEKEIEQKIKWNNRMRALYAKRGREYDEEELDREKAIALLNYVVLNANDVKSNNIEEVLVGNWSIEGWYFRWGPDKEPFPLKFWKKALEAGIKKPVYGVTMSGRKHEFDLQSFFKEKEDKTNESLVRDLVRKTLKEEIGRSYHTPNVDPIDIMEQEGIRVSSYFDSSNDTINVAIEKYNEKNDEWEEIFDKEFSDPLDAQFWMRQQVEKYQRKNFSKDIDLTDQD